MLVGFLAALAAGSGVDNNTWEIFNEIASLQQAGPARLPELHAALDQAHIGLSVKVFADGRAQDNRLSMGVRGCYVERRCPDDSVTAARALARHTNAPPLVWEWIDVFETGLEADKPHSCMLGFGVADDGAKLHISRSVQSKEYPPLPLGRRLSVADVLRAHNLTDGLALEAVSLEWSVKEPDRGVRLRIYHSEPRVLSALDRWATHHNITPGRLSMWAAQLAWAAPHAQLIWVSPLYEPSAQLEPPPLFPTKLAIAAPAVSGGGKDHSRETDGYGYGGIDPEDLSFVATGIHGKGTSPVQVSAHMSDTKCRAREGGHARDAHMRYAPPPVCTVSSHPVLRPWTGASEE